MIVLTAPPISKHTSRWEGIVCLGTLEETKSILLTEGMVFPNEAATFGLIIKISYDSLRCFLKILAESLTLWPWFFMVIFPLYLHSP
ncbi:MULTISPECIES: hypothetical protein [unclassified Apibacter]|uniref:hypothetical protein n=1 Tax=unclassified Apibacter TaxID=2630820 RepID=UPI0021075505|nr:MULTISPECIES: hypothetical protein [unclassified Apibacter]